MSDQKFWTESSQELFVDKFIGREDLLAIVDEAIADGPNNHVITFVGEGGIGKTALLRRMAKKYDKIKDIILVQLDFTKSEVLGGHLAIIEIAISQWLKQGLLNQNDLKTTLKGIYDPARKADVEGQKKEEIDDLLQRGDRKIINYVNNKIKVNNKRVLFIFDSIDEASEEVMRDVASIFSLVENGVCIFAGRDEDEVAAMKYFNVLFPDIYGSKGWHVTEPLRLGKFTVAETAKYFAKVLPSGLKSGLVETIYILTAGKPVLLALTAEWFKDNVQLPEGINKSKQELEALEPYQLLRLQRHFEMDLVESVRAVRQPLDLAILYMSFLDRRYDKLILQLALDYLPPGEVEALEPRLRRMAFIRSFLDDSSGLLHDEAKRLINQYAWPPYDPTGEERFLLARKVIDGFYKPKIKELRTAVAIAIKKTGVQQVYQPKDRLAHELEMECLDYHLKISLDEGRSYVTQLIKEEISLRKREGIRHEITKRAGEAEAEVAVARMNLRRGQFEGNQEIVEQALKEKALSPWYRMTLLYELSDAPTNPEEKAAYLERAMEIAEQTRDQKAAALIYNDLGLMFRRQGLWDKAEESYGETLKILKFVDDPDQKASTLNNLAYVKFLQGDLDLAEHLADMALKERDKLGNQLGIAFSHLTKGQIVQANGHHVQAVRDYGMAARLFKKLGRDQNHALALVYLSETKRMDRDFEAAEALLGLGLEQPLSEIRARAERELAALYRTQGMLLEEPAEKNRKYEAAIATFQKSLQTSQLKRDWYGQAQALYDLIFMGFIIDGTIDEDYSKQLNAVLADHNYPILQAQLAELYAEVKYYRGEVQTAFKAYIDVANILSRRNIRKYNDMFARFKDKFLAQSSQIQHELSDYFEEVIAELPPQSRLHSSLSSLCRALQLAY